MNVLALIGGVVALWYGGHIWHGGKKEKKKHWFATVVLLLILAGLGIAGGATLLGFLGFLDVKIVGVLPVWLLVALVVGGWMVVDLIMRQKWTQTPILGFITAAMIAVPVAPAFAAHQAHVQGPQLTSVSHRG